MCCPGYSVVYFGALSTVLSGLGMEQRASGLPRQPVCRLALRGASLRSVWPVCFHCCLPALLFISVSLGMERRHVAGWMLHCIAWMEIPSWRDPPVPTLPRPPAHGPCRLTLLTVSFQGCDSYSKASCP